MCVDEGSGVGWDGMRWGGVGSDKRVCECFHVHVYTASIVR